MDVQTLNIYKDIEQIIININIPVINLNSGWHFSYFGDVNFIINKIKSFSHQEFNSDKYIDEKWLEYAINNRKDLFFREYNIKYITIEENQYLPQNYKMLLK